MSTVQSDGPALHRTPLSDGVMLLLRRTRPSGRELWSRCAVFALTVSSGQQLF